MPSLSVGRVLLASLRAWRRDFVFLSVLAAIVETPLVVLQLALHATPGLEISTEVSATGTARVLSMGVPLMVYGILAHHFLSGVMESVEGAERAGHPRPTLVELARHLPWVRLLIADLAINLLTLAGLLLLIVPGIVIGTYLTIVLPLTNMEGQSIGPTLRRSVSLVRGHFWRTLAVWAITGVVLDAIQEAVSDVLTHLNHSTLWEFVTHLGTDVLFLPLQALPVVMLAFDLVAIDAARHPERAAGPPSGPAPGAGSAAGPAGATD